MLERARNLIRRREASPRLHWLSSDIAIGGVDGPEDWRAVYDAGVRAVVDLRAESKDLGAEVRQNGMRYLRLCLPSAPVPSAEELQIVASWVLERAAEDGRVLIHDAQSRFNDGLVAVASLIKSGLPAHLALLALRRAMPKHSFDRDQHTELVRFTAAQPAG
jgi:hypothetical protein